MSFLDIGTWVAIVAAVVSAIYAALTYHIPPSTKSMTKVSAASQKLTKRDLIFRWLPTVVAVAAVSFDYYDRHSQPVTWTSIPNIMMQWGYQPPNENEITFDGSKLLSLQNDYKIVGVALHYDGKEDVLDENNLLVSSEYSITPFPMTMVIPWSSQYTSEVEAGEKNTTYYLLALPNGMTTGQFSTLRQAKALGAIILADEGGPP
jgi:hypothetical protein